MMQFMPKVSQGGQTQSSFLSWMKRVFLVYAAPQRPVILFIDGHKTHMTLDLIDVAQSSGVILFCLPPQLTLSSHWMLPFLSP